MAKKRAQCTVPFGIANRDWCPYELHKAASNSSIDGGNLVLYEVVNHPTLNPVW